MFIITLTDKVIHQNCNRWCYDVNNANSTHLITVLREILNSRESTNLDIRKLVGCSIHLGNNGVIAVLVFFTKLFPDGCKLFAVAAPRSIYANISSCFAFFCIQENCLLLTIYRVEKSRVFFTIFNTIS